MQFYSHKNECIECGKSFTEFRSSSSPPRRKKCPSCNSNKRKGKVFSLEGEEGRRCKDCVNFKKWSGVKLSEPYYGRCGLGYTPDDEDEFALNGELYGLVYIEDVCDDFQPLEED